MPNTAYVFMADNWVLGAEFIDTVKMIFKMFLLSTYNVKSTIYQKWLWHKDYVAEATAFILLIQYSIIIMIISLSLRISICTDVYIYNLIKQSEYF